MARKKTKKKRGSKGRQRSRWSQLAAGFLLGEPMEDDTAARVRELGGLALIGLSLWLLLSLVTFDRLPLEGTTGVNLGGDLGFHIANGVLMYAGLAGYLLALLGLAWGVVMVARHEIQMPFIRGLGVFASVLAVAFVLDLGFGPSTAERQIFFSQRDQLAQDGIFAALSNDLPYGPGGLVALEANPVLVQRFGAVGLWIVLLTLSIMSLLLATQMAFYNAIVAFGEWLDERENRMGERLLPAVGGWFKRLAIGIWDFLRGADLAPAPAVRSGSKRSSRGRSGKKAAPKKKPEPLPDLDELDDVDEGDLEAEAETEYEYFDEDGNPIDPSDLDEYEEAEGEDEWEYEEDEVEEEDVIVPAAKADEAEDDEPGLDFDQEASEKSRKAAEAALNRMAAISQPVYDPPTPPIGPWELPSFDLLAPPAGGATVDKEFLETSAQNLENALKSFRVEAEVVGAQVGPAVTMFELTVAQGTRMNKVTALSQEIAATLRARSVRIIAPIPGKSTIGIEVPNAKRRTVRISELVTQKAYDPDYMALPLFLGMDAEGKSIVEDLARAPHMLIAGTTGSGKSVCINTIVASFLLTRSPHDVKLILIDPKMVELQMFQEIPHLQLPVVTDMKQATNVLIWAVEKMESRYELFKNAGVKNIKTYNKLGEKKLRERLGEDFNEEYTPRHVPYIVLIIDEMADLMMQSKKEAEQAITR
ncbi:MAG: DNA translocase FtsK 4TM domain-containing protein, partial [Planctomycetota bacterium]|nr:DNA translocase FtsK 4TM domain-containing protein [Planctomycetota bacterium]